jgi:hypothetical protein
MGARPVGSREMPPLRLPTATKASRPSSPVGARQMMAQTADQAAVICFRRHAAKISPVKPSNIIVHVVARRAQLNGGGRIGAESHSSAIARFRSLAEQTEARQFHRLLACAVASPGAVFLVP